MGDGQLRKVPYDMRMKVLEHQQIQTTTADKN